MAMPIGFSPAPTEMVCTTASLAVSMTLKVASFFIGDEGARSIGEEDDAAGAASHGDGLDGLAGGGIDHGDGALVLGCDVDEFGVGGEGDAFGFGAGGHGGEHGTLDGVDEAEAGGVLIGNVEETILADGELFGIAAAGDFAQQFVLGDVEDADAVGALIGRGKSALDRKSTRL